MTRRDDRELRALLADLDETLGALRRELDDDRPAREPPTAGELVRFTEEYTIPTAIAALEAAVAALELLQGLLGLAARGDRALDDVGDVGDAATTGVERTLSELRRALRESDLPDDPETRDVVREARELTEAVERRIEASGRQGRADRGVDIDVSEEGSGGEDPVEAELRSIRKELDDRDET